MGHARASTRKRVRHLYGVMLVENSFESGNIGFECLFVVGGEDKEEAVSINGLRRPSANAMAIGAIVTMCTINSVGFVAIGCAVSIGTVESAMSVGTVDAVASLLSVGDGRGVEGFQDHVSVGPTIAEIVDAGASQSACWPRDAFRRNLQCAITKIHFNSSAEKCASFR